MTSPGPAGTTAQQAQPGRMRAVEIASHDGPGAVRLAQVAAPQPSEDRVLVEVHAAGVSFPELLQTRGRYQISPDLPFVPGSEISGIVRAAPAGGHVQPGERVAAFCGIGGFAELVAVQPPAVFPLPASTPLRDAAALPMNYLTMLFGLTRRGALRAGETVLVHGAAGGIGTATIQLARALGARVIAVTSSDRKADVARQAGADEVVDAADFRAQTAALTGGRGVDVVVDPVGGDRFTDSLRSLAPEGRLLVVGFTGGEIPTVKVNRLLLNNIAVVGVGWGAFWSAGPGYLQEQWREMVPLLEAGRLRPVLGSVHPLEDVVAALRELDERRALGKVLLELRSETLAA